MSKLLRAIGLMSGTSMDGIDVAYLETDGEKLVRQGPSATYAYDERQRDLLGSALLEAKAITQREQRPGNLVEIESQLTQWHVEAARKFMLQHKLTAQDIDIIGFHGQTILHRPDLGFTVQLGDGAALAKVLGIKTVYDLRAADMAAGGQGAPLVPIYHAALARNFPSIFVNIGGISNVTYVGQNGELIAFDCGPGNAQIDDWVKKHSGLAYDEGGKICLTGTIGRGQVQAAMAQTFFARKPPKSLDRNELQLDLSAFSLADGAATLAAFTVQAIAASEKYFPEKPKQWIICGGGRHNAALMQGLKSLLQGVVSAEEFEMNGDAIEAEAWAYLAVRSLYSLPISFPGTTGVIKPTTGGVLAVP